MNRYFINGHEVTRAQAEEQLKINDEINQIIEVTAWMPLPEPYKAESEEKTWNTSR